jgi:hypothetical protein
VLSAAFVDCTCLYLYSSLFVVSFNLLGVKLVRIFGIYIYIFVFNLLGRFTYYFVWDTLAEEGYAYKNFCIVLFICYLFIDFLAVGDCYVLEWFLEWDCFLLEYFSAGDTLLFFLLNVCIITWIINSYNDLKF